MVTTTLHVEKQVEKKDNFVYIPMVWFVMHGIFTRKAINTTQLTLLETNTLPTELLRQLRWLGGITHTKQHNSRQSVST